DDDVVTIHGSVSLSPGGRPGIGRHDRTVSAHSKRLKRKRLLAYDRRGVLSVNPQERAATIERLLQEGLDLYQARMADHAVAAWTEVLHMQPDEPRALAYLRQGGAGAPCDDNPGVHAGGERDGRTRQCIRVR